MTDSAALPGDNNEPIVPIEPITPVEPDGELHTLLNYFHAALFEPVSTLKKLTAETATRTKELWFEAFLVVVIAGAIMGGVKSQSASQLLFFVTSRILDMLLFWYRKMSRKYRVRIYQYLIVLKRNHILFRWTIACTQETLTSQKRSFVNLSCRRTNPSRIELHFI